MYGLINAVMLGTEPSPGEPDWNQPDFWTEEDFLDLVGMDAATYAEAAPHMIVWVL